MEKSVPTTPMPKRLGLPLDPLLQLWGGEVVELGTVTLTGAIGDQIAVPNPERVALYIVPVAASGGWYVWPAGSAMLVQPNATIPNTLMVIHCRDYPGIVQGAWVASGMVGQQLRIMEYTLQSWWT